MQKWNLKTENASKHRLLLWCSLVWARHLASHLGYKFIMSGVRLWAKETLRMEWRCSSVRRVPCEMVLIFIKVNSCSHGYVLPHIERCEQPGRQLGHRVGDKRGNCSAHILICCLQRVAASELHVEVWWRVFHFSYKWITEQFKPAFLGFKIGKSPCECLSNAV